ncbi:carboxylesterase [Alcanivorax hongdengensis A-11-3]|uniref:Carboxylesterase n=1 Tax=Alcanivorax hongdengensis A-11-3 TaxID=1177179 RepID=L0W7U2_9GAMM|nr:carboxylesterase family protein [Alcanivorax hongdengensis]EKF72966.1 carboxylesterase [Alcanivorax hongdengensis A-11-3]
MIANTAVGRFEGVPGEGVTEFRGVPFALAPVGENRFRAPRPLPPSRQTVRADRYPMPSLQMHNPMMGITESDEDCLYLNIWVPEGEGPFPVMVWFHGGGYLAGSISQPLYNGAALARNQQVVVVHAAYRLGAMGFADFTAVAPELGADSNLGLRDQVAALEWVRDHVGGFAGDPSRVTLFGESAGGFSVCALLATPRAQPLFHNAIVQSGGADFALAPAEVGKVTEAFVQGLPGEGSAGERLRAADSKAWIQAQNQAIKVLVKRGLRDTTPQFAMNFLPMVDGDLLPQLPIEAIAAGAAADKRVLASVCADEYHFFQYSGVMAGSTSMAALREMDDSEILRRFERALPGNGERAFRHYRETVTPNPARSQLDWLSAMESDRLFRVPTLRLLDAQSAHNGDCWGAQFTWPCTMMGIPLDACHVVDVPFVFGITGTPVGQFFTGGGDQAAQLAEQVQNAWGNLAHGREPQWPRWHEARQVHQFGPGDALTALFDEAEEALWQAIIPAPEIPLETA